MTGEQVFTEFNLVYRPQNHTLSWSIEGDKESWEALALALTTKYTVGAEEDAIGPHVASSYQKPSPQADNSWDQFYSKSTGINETRIKELFAEGRSKENIIRMYANLSYDELERILGEQ